MIFQIFELDYLADNLDFSRFQIWFSVFSGMLVIQLYSKFYRNLIEMNLLIDLLLWSKFQSLLRE